MTIIEKLSKLVNGQRIVISAHTLTPYYLQGNIPAITHKGTTGIGVDYIYFVPISVDKHGALSITKNEIIDILT